MNLKNFKNINKKFFIGGAVILVLVGIFVFTSVTKNMKKGGDDIYYCPMHPTYTSDRPGNCPICNMNLVKKEPEIASPPAGVRNDTSKEPATNTDHAGMVHEHAGADPAHDVCYLHNCPMTKEGKSCPMLVVAKEGENVECPICKKHVAERSTSSAKRKILYWTDPMIPGFRAEGPGKSPMGMDLVPVYEEETPSTGAVAVESPEGYAPILVTSQKQQLIGVKTAPVGRKTIQKVIRTVGTIAYDPELYQAQAEFIQAIQAYERAKQSGAQEVIDQAGRLVDSAKIHLRHMGLSEELIDEAAQLKEADRGLLFSRPGEPVWVYAKLYEYDLPFVKIGQEVTAEIPSLADQTFKGKIRSIDPIVDPMTRTTRMRAQLEDPQGFLRPDMYVNVAVKIDFGEVIAVPEEAVFSTGERNIVFVSKPNGLFEPRNVTLGAKAEGFYEIRSGIEEGELAVTSGNFLIDSESRLKGALESMGGGGHKHGQ